MEYKFKTGQRVHILDVSSLGGRKEWAGKELTLKRHDSDGWDEPGWSVEEPGCHYRFRESEMALVDVGPIRTETVTVRRLEPGVYGRLSVHNGTSEAKNVFAGITNLNGVSQGGQWVSAPELRELARVALEIAEYLENA